MGSSVRILSLGGIPIYVHASWLAVYALITWTLAVGYLSLKDITHVLVLRGLEPAPRPLVGAGDLRRAA